MAVSDVRMVGLQMLENWLIMINPIYSSSS